MKWLSVYARPLILAGAAAILSGCSRPQGAFTIAGSTAFEPLAHRMAEAFMREHPGHRITVQSVDSATAIHAAAEGIAALGVADIVTFPPEASNLVCRVAALDGIGVVINPANTITNLTTDQIRDIFSGRLRNWKDVGGAEHEINVVTREVGSGTRRSLEELLRCSFSFDRPVIQDSSGSLRETVAKDPNAIGYLSRSFVDERVRAVAVNGVPCSPETVTSGEYSLVRRICLITRTAPTGAVKDFLDYLQSAAGTSLLRQNGLIPVTE